MNPSINSHLEEIQYSVMAKNARDVLMLLSIDGKIVEANDAAIKLYGYEREELLQMSIYDLRKHDSAEEVSRILESARLQEVLVETRHTKKNGQIVPVEVSARCVVLQNQPMFVSVIRDITERKQAENALREAHDQMDIRIRERTAELVKTNEALRESEEKYHQLFVTISDAAILYDASTLEIMEVNDVALRLYGYDRDEFLRLNRSEIFASVKPQSNLSSKYNHDNNLFARLHYHKKKDGSLFAVEISTGVFTLKGSQIHCDIIRDFSDRLKMEDDLFNSRQTLRAILDNIPQRVFWKDCNFRYLGCNMPFALDGGYSSPEEIIGLTDFEASWKRSASHYQEVDDWVMAHDRAKYDFEEIQIRWDGSTVWLRTNKVPIHDREGKVVGVLGSYEDITERKNAENALRESEDRYRCLVEMTPDAILIHQEDRIIFHNSATLELFGARNSSDLLGKSLLDFVDTPNRSKFKDQIHSLNKWRSSITTTEENLRRLDGEIRRVEIFMTLFYDKGKSGILILLHDITEKRRLEKEILEIADREQQRIGQDLHDQLCQYLSGIKFRVNLLQQKMGNRSSNIAKDAALIEDLLNQANQQARDIARGLVPVEIEANGLMSAIDELADRTSKMYGVSCVCHCKTPVLVHNHFIALHLYRITQEAVNNSVKHGKSESILINLHANEKQIVLSIQDSGLGLPADTKTTKGMGLRIMNYRARLIGASLLIKRRKIKGTIVTCIIPIDAATLRTQ